MDVKPEWKPNSGTKTALVSWELKAGDRGEWFEIANGFCAQVIGDFGIGGKCSIEGTHDVSVEGCDLADIQGGSVLQAPGFLTISLPPRFIRPAAIDGDSATLLKIMVTVPQ